MRYHLAQTALLFVVATMFFWGCGLTTEQIAQEKAIGSPYGVIEAVKDSQEVALIVKRPGFADTCATLEQLVDVESMTLFKLFFSFAGESYYLALREETDTALVYVATGDDKPLPSIKAVACKGKTLRVMFPGGGEVTAYVLGIPGREKQDWSVRNTCGAVLLPLAVPLDTTAPLLR